MNNVHAIYNTYLLKCKCTEKCKTRERDVECTYIYIYTRIIYIYICIYNAGGCIYYNLSKDLIDQEL